VITTCPERLERTVTQQLVVIAVDDPSKAQEMLLAAGRLAKDGKLGLDDAVIITKSADGKTHKIETTDITPTEGGLGGAFWGLLFGTLLAGPVGGLVTGAVTGGAGALMAKIIDRGIADDFIVQMETLLEPGHAALCLLTNFSDQEAAIRELNRFDGTLLWSNLPPEAAAEINAALSQGDTDQAIPVTGEVSSEPTAPPAPPAPRTPPAP
jgi:uncharacterized membrane protein